LVVEDEPAIRSLLAVILAAQGHEVDEARDGLEALRRLNEQTYDLIVSDMRMPGLDGPGLYHELQRRGPADQPRLLFVSGSSSVQAYEDFLATAKVPVLEKPFNLDELCRVVERILAAP
jgi:CheY-like chemotaxis protein